MFFCGIYGGFVYVVQFKLKEVKLGCFIYFIIYYKNILQCVWILWCMKINMVVVLSVIIQFQEYISFCSIVLLRWVCVEKFCN